MTVLGCDDVGGKQRQSSSIQRPSPSARSGPRRAISKLGARCDACAGGRPCMARSSAAVDDRRCLPAPDAAAASAHWV